MTRKAGPGNAAIADTVLPLLQAQLQLVGQPKRAAEAGKVDRVRFEGEGWSLDVRDDGNTVRFRREAIAVGALDQKPDDIKIEAEARGLAQELVASLSARGEGEELVFLGTKFSYSGSHQTDAASPDPEQVDGWAAAFGRNLNGEIVIGGGSMVVIEYDGAGVVRAVDIDWPEYESANIELSALGTREIKARAENLGAKAEPGGSRREHKFECGYFDPGGRKRVQQKLVQPACFYSLLSTDAAGSEYGVIVAVPATEKPWTRPIGRSSRSSARKSSGAPPGRNDVNAG
jgi:hypothetical protein